MAITGNPVVGLGPVDELLASVPPVSQKVSGKNDGIVSSGQRDAGMAPATGRPTLATVKDPVLRFRTVDGLVRSQDRLAQNRWAIDLYHRRVRSNVAFAYLEKVPNQAVWIAKMPIGVSRERSASTPNKADDLCNKVENALMADPAKPSPQPHTNGVAADRAGELSASFLRELMGESGLNWEQIHRWALNIALTCASTFLHYDVDPQGGGVQPAQIMAHPKATDPAKPLQAVDPQTGIPLPTADPILRYVSPKSPEFPAGQFVAEASQADQVWLPAITCRRMRREQVRMFPPQADIEAADTVILIDWMTLAEAIAKWPDTVGKMDDTALMTLASWRPPLGGDQAVPFALRGSMGDGQTGPSVSEVGTASPLMQRRMFYYRYYQRQTPEYGDGFVLDISGYNNGTVLGEDTLAYDVTLPVGGKERRCRDIPLEQIRPQQDTESGDPMGWPFINRFAGASDAKTMLYSAYQDAINARLHPHVFIRSTAAVDDEDWADRSVPIILNPTDPEPTYENFSSLPGEFLPMIQNMDEADNSSAGLGETAQATETSTSVSGVAKQITVQQADKNLRGMLAQFNAAQTRGWRICLQLAQAKYTVPQLIDATGEGGSDEAEWWTGEDLAGVDEVGIEPGTGSMMTPEGKANLVAYAQSMGWMPVRQAAKVGLTGVTRELGLPEDATEQAIEREMALWFKGPPNEEWLASAQQYQTQLAAYNELVQAGQASGQPVTEPAPTPPWTPFRARPNDDEPVVAEAWREALSQAMMSPEYAAQPPEWQQVLNTRYTQARQAITNAQQAQAAQQAATSPSGPPPDAPSRETTQTVGR